MKLFVAQYTTWQDVLANLDDRRDAALEFYCASSPQFHSIAQSEHPAWIQRCKDDVEEDVRMAWDEDASEFLPDDKTKLEWEDGEWRFPEHGRPNREFHLYDRTNPNEHGMPDAVLVVQQYEVE